MRRRPATGPERLRHAPLRAAGQSWEEEGQHEQDDADCDDGGDEHGVHRLPRERTFERPRRVRRGAMRRLTTTLITALAALLATAATAVAAAPDATTAPATAVGIDSATLGGTVAPRGLPTTWHVEYGTSTAYGVRTSDTGAGAGAAPVTVAVPVGGLSSSTTYHFRLVATNADGTARGVDRTLRTAPAPARPIVALGGTQRGPDQATVTGRIDPRGAQTTFHWEYGTTTRYGASTPDQTLPAGRGAQPVSATITALAPFTTYHARLVASNPLGTTRSVDRAFRTDRRPTSVTATVDPAVARWSAGVIVLGRVAGEGAGGLDVALERQDFPYDQPFRQEGTTARTSSTGVFRLVSLPLWANARFRVVTRTAVVAASPVVSVATRVLVGLKIARTGAAGYTVSGAISPAVPSGRASLQRQTRTGRWIPVARAGVEPLRGNRSRYTIAAGQARSASPIRVVVTPADAGAHARGFSRELRARLR